MTFNFIAQRTLFVSVFLAAAAFAAEVKPVEGKPADGKPADQKPAEAKPGEKAKPADKTVAPKPFLGVRFDDSAVSLDHEPGMPISEVVVGSTAQTMGLEAGDRLLSLNTKATERTDDLTVILGGAKVGDTVNLEYLRAGVKTHVQGVLVERPKPATLAKDVDRINQKLAEVRELAESQKREPTLAEILQQLKDIEAGLPRAVAAFKKQFPDGEFDIRLQVVITSDKNAKSPIVFSNQTSKTDDKQVDNKQVDEKKVDEKKPEVKKVDDKKVDQKKVDEKKAAEPTKPPAK